MENKTGMPIVAGVLDIFSGVISLICFVGLLIATLAIGWEAGHFNEWNGWYFEWYYDIGIALGVLITLTVLSFIVGLLALIGGIYALQRKKWGWALTGSIFALSPTFLLGLVAIILTAASKNEFE
jgi:hypothetical protein